MRRAGSAEWCRWLADRGVIALDGIDTRSLVLAIRASGSLRAAIAAGPHDLADVLDRVRAEPPMAGRSLVAGVSTRTPYEVGSGPARVTVVDYGCKRSIVRRLVSAGARVRVVPHDATVETILDGPVDGVLLSNGPGDPAALPDQVSVVRELLGRTPVLGICLGHQLLGLALGHVTSKLPFGHRGANHPVLATRSGRVLVTSQNHGFAVQGDGPEVSHVSLYDGTVEGLEVPGERVRSVQFHPEAGPGPHDAWAIIEDWVGEVTGLARAA
jgi:carbamoyl-phosphate synthase small subunit